jgi:hypothetical protein
LKFALGKQGDVINEQKFHTLEMRAYDKSLPLTADIWTVLIIKFSFWFSDFGQSFIRPLKALLIGHFLLMLLFINAGGIRGVTLSLGDANIQGFQMALEKYVFLINPLRKIVLGNCCSRSYYANMGILYALQYCACNPSIYQIKFKTD